MAISMSTNPTALQVADEPPRSSPRRRSFEARANTSSALEVVDAPPRRKSFEPGYGVFGSQSGADRAVVGEPSPRRSSEQGSTMWRKGSNKLRAIQAVSFVASSFHAGQNDAGSQPNSPLRRRLSGLKRKLSRPSGESEASKELAKSAQEAEELVKSVDAIDTSLLSPTLKHIHEMIQECGGNELITSKDAPKPGFDILEWLHVLADGDKKDANDEVPVQDNSREDVTMSGSPEADAKNNKPLRRKRSTKAKTRNPGECEGSSSESEFTDISPTSEGDAVEARVSTEPLLETVKLEHDANTQQTKRISTTRRASIVRRSVPDGKAVTDVDASRVATAPVLAVSTPSPKRRHSADGYRGGRRPPTTEPLTPNSLPSVQELACVRAKKEAILKSMQALANRTSTLDININISSLWRRRQDA